MVTIDTMLERWSGLERPLFKGKLIDAEGCKCAQGDVLFCAGFTDAQLRNMEQSEADKETAKILGISRTHAVLLRYVNDKSSGCPQLVLSNPEQIIGDKAPILLAFWLYLDSMSKAASWDAGWEATLEDALEAIRKAAVESAGEAAQDTAWSAAAWEAARYAAWVTPWASTEIQGMDKLEADGREPYFLAFFGFKTWDIVRALAKPRGNILC
jgi:hypothetical protein